MERGLIWYILSVKNYLVKRSTYLTAAGMLLLVLVISGITIPSAQNMKVGVICGESEIANQMLNRLKESRADFDFVEYQDVDDMIEAVIGGTLDCGFVFSDDFDEMCEEADIKDGISFYATSFSTKGEVLKESLCAAYLECYTPYFFADIEKDIFRKQDTERLENMIADYQLYLKGNDIFQMEIQHVKTNLEETEASVKVDFVAGLVGLTIFLIMFFAYGESQRKGNDCVELALTRGQQIAYRFVKMLASALVPSVVGFLLIIMVGKPDGFFIELGKIILFLIVSALWIILLGKWFSRSEDLSIWMLGLILLHVLVCPIFFDFAAYVPAIEWIRCLLPLGIYLVL